MASSSISLTPDNEFIKWKMYYQIHGKSISELNPAIHTIIRKYAIIRLYELSQSTPSIKPKVDDFFKMLFSKGQAEKIALTFNVDKYCIYEDYTKLIETIYERAEEEYKGKICKNDLTNYLEIIAGYRLLIDMIDLVKLWKEKDENIKKFELFCKHRVITIFEKKKKEKTFKGKECEIDQEFNDLANEIKEEEKKNILSRTKTTIEDNTLIVQPKGIIKTQLNNKQTAKVNNEINDITQLRRIVTGMDNPYGDIFASFHQQPIHHPLPNQELYYQSQIHYQEQQQQHQHQNQHQHQQEQNYQQEQHHQQEQKYQQEQQHQQEQQYQQEQQHQQEQQYQQVQQYQQEHFIQYKPKDTNQLVQSVLPSITKVSSIQITKNQFPINHIQLPQHSQNDNLSLTKKNILNRKKKNEIYDDEIEQMLKELNEDPKKDKHKKEESVELTEMIDNNNILTNNPFQISGPYQYLTNNYFLLLKYLKSNVIQSIMKDIQDNNYEQALKNSELIFYYLSNIIPKN